jgi:lysophospholipase L1-like esterase
MKEQPVMKSPLGNKVWMVFVASIIARTAVAAVNITNPSFESSQLSTSTYTKTFGTLDPLTGVPGWTFGASTITPGSLDGIARLQGGFNMTAPLDGSQAAFIQGTGAFSQSLTGFVDGWTDVSFFCEGRPNGYGPQPIQVSLDNTVLTFTGVTTLSPATGGWVKYTTDPVQVTAGSHKLTFTGTVPYGAQDKTSFIDSISVFNGTAPPPPPPLKICPLGDSITYGDSGTYTTPGGYRDRLYTNLKNAGRNVQFVGSDASNPSPTLTAAGQVAHDGHGGWTIDQIAAQVDTWLPSYKPDVILLMIGSNDLVAFKETAADAKNRLVSLINKIVTDCPAATVFVSNIIPVQSNDSRGVYADGSPINPTVIAYDDLIRTEVVPGFQAAGKNVSFVDQYSNFVDSNGKIRASQFGNYEHPSTAGYVSMGDTWFNAMTPVPEPSSLVLVAIAVGLLAGISAVSLLAALRRRRCKHAT